MTLADRNGHPSQGIHKRYSDTIVNYHNRSKKIIDIILSILTTVVHNSKFPSNTEVFHLWPIGSIPLKLNLQTEKYLLCGVVIVGPNTSLH